jgi:hypothetical protein
MRIFVEYSSDLKTEPPKYYSQILITGSRYPDLRDIRTEICPYIEYEGCVINKENVPII